MLKQSFNICSKRVSESSDLEQKSMKFDQRFYQHQQIVRKPDRLKPKKLKTEFVEGRSCLQTTQQVYRPGTPLGKIVKYFFLYK